jgi:hypothetical protein
VDGTDNIKMGLIELLKLATSGTKTPRVLPGCLIVHDINPLNAELNPVCHLLALLGVHHVFHVSGLRVKIHLRERG